MRAPNPREQVYSQHQIPMIMDLTYGNSGPLSTTERGQYRKDHDDLAHVPHHPSPSMDAKLSDVHPLAVSEGQTRGTPPETSPSITQCVKLQDRCSKPRLMES